MIVGSASGGFSGAIVLYETALGLGIASGPLLGGLLGNVSWRGPFFGVSVLMLIALVATIAWVPAMPRPAGKSSIKEPILVLAGAALLTTVRGALDAADADEAQPGPSAERDGAIAAVAQIPGLPEEAITAEADLATESRA